MSLADIIAKRRAALAAASILPDFIPKAEEIIKDEPIITKTMTFAEKMAEKKLLMEKNKSAAQPAFAPTDLQLAKAKAEQEAMLRMSASINEVKEDLIDDSEDLDRAEVKVASAEVQQSYKEIKNLVYSLQDTDDDDLVDAMSKLKKALLANPNACLLMLDQDIGKMTIALRRVTQEALIEATKEKKPKTPGKNTTSTKATPLTAQQMEAVFAEL